MRFGPIIALAAILLATNQASAQSESTRLAAYESLPVANTNLEVGFAKRLTKVGDRIDQQINAELDLESTVRQGQETLEQTRNKVGRQQKRAVIVDKVVDGKTAIARVHFAEYLRTQDGETTPQKVAGNTYRCEREEDDTLSITKADGSLTSPDEFTLVSQCMVSLGRTNPLADFLDGRKLKTGETVEVPREVGEALLSSDGQMGKVVKFQITLTEYDQQAQIAKLKIALETEGAETTQMRLSVQGEIEVESDTCRTRSMTLTGPLIMATTTGSYSAAKTTFVRGRLQIDSQARYSE